MRKQSVFMYTVFVVALFCLLSLGCGVESPVYSEGFDDSGQWYVDVDGCRYINLHDSVWYYDAGRFNTFIGRIEKRNVRLYADDSDPNRLLLKQTTLFDFCLSMNLSMLVREDMLPDVSKDKVTYIRIYSIVINSDTSLSLENVKIINDIQGIEEFNNLLLSNNPGLKSNMYELTRNEGWIIAYRVHYFYAKTDQLYRSPEIFRNPEGEYYILMMNSELVKIEDGRLKELITETR